MSFYSDVLLPRICHLSMRNRRLLPYRKRATGLAEGRVLEIGVGSGLNLPLYGASVREILALEPDAQLIAIAQRLTGSAAMPVTFMEASAEAIPMEDDSVDTVITTCTLCTSPQSVTALLEIRRVLRPSGRLVFVEHGLAPDQGVRWWQDRLTPAWRCISGGRHLNRPIRNLIEDGGFRVERLETGYMPGPKPFAFMYDGTALPK